MTKRNFKPPHQETLPHWKMRRAISDPRLEDLTPDLLAISPCMHIRGLAAREVNVTDIDRTNLGNAQLMKYGTHLKGTRQAYDLIWPILFLSHFPDHGVMDTLQPTLARGLYICIV